MSTFSLDFTITGTNRVNTHLRALASANPKETDPIIGKHTKKTAAILRAEPPPNKLPNQQYVRTGTLSRAFRAQKRGAAKWAVINRTPYGVWVIKEGMQNRMYHLGRWWIFEKKAQKTMPKLTKSLSRMLEQLMDSQ